MIYVTKEFKDMIYLMHCGAKGITPILNNPVNWGGVYCLAQSHGVSALVFTAIKQLPDNDKSDIGSDLYSTLNVAFYRTVLHQFRRLEFIHNTIKHLEDNGIECCLFKGESLAMLYHTPSCRISSDTDILISPELEMQCVRLLKKYGYIVMPRNSGSHHFVCQHPLGGRLEIHVALCGDITNDIFFNNQIPLTGKTEEIVLENRTVLKIPESTDYMIYLFLHLIKHFLSAGIGIRQFYDIFLFAEAHGNSVDWSRIRILMDDLGYSRFIAAAIKIGNKYFGFSNNMFSDIEIDDELLEKILADVEQGGIFGISDNQRKDFYNIYVKERFTKLNKGNFPKYMKRHYGKISLRQVFPCRAHMSVNYPYVSKCPLLLPMAWVHRGANIFYKIITQQSKIHKYTKHDNLEKLNPVLEARLTLVKNLDMI